MAENSADLQVLQGNNQFATNLYKALSGNAGNVIFSPISVHAVLSMAYQGAQGSTSESLASTLQVPEAQTAGEGYNEIMKRLNSVENVTLLMANKVFLRNGFKLLTDFATAITNNFLSEVQLVDFGQSEAAAKIINSWIVEKTHGKISGLMQKESFNDLTRMVLVNAIYFKGNWKYQFNKYNTKTKLFYLNDVNTVNVQMMHMKRKFSYKFDFTLDAQILEMRYVNEDLSMIIILPNKRNGIDDLEKKLATANLTEITRGMWPTEVDVALPKFKIEQTIDLKDALVKLGLGEIFQVGANFRGMIEMYTYENLYVSEVVQKAFIEVNEEGAEAAAVTAVTMMMFGSAGPPPRPTLFIADHPFVFLLSSCHKFQTNILFTGRVSNPNF